MALVQLHSDAWEALYIEKPNFSRQCDHLIIDAEEILGVISGHKVQTPEGQNVYSIEILAVHPEHQNKGLAKAMILELSYQLPKTSLLTFWTRTTLAKAWYEHLNMSLIDQRHQFFKTSHPKQIWNLVKPTTAAQQANLWCFACTCPVI